MSFCPNCVTELHEDTKKLGSFTKWLICPDCGFRTRPNTDNETPHINKKVKLNKRFIEDEANGRYNI